MASAIIFCLVVCSVITFYAMWITYFTKIPLILRFLPLLPIVIYLFFFTWIGGELFSKLFPADKHWVTTHDKQIYHLKGTGVFINGYDVLTNAHVIQDCDAVGVIDKDEFYPAFMIATSLKDTPNENQADIAILRTQANRHGFVSISTDPPIPEEAIHFPNLSPWNRGKFYRRDGNVIYNEQMFFWFSGISRPGNSGSPVFNRNQQLIGILHSVKKRLIFPSLNRGTQSQYLASFLQSHYIPFSTDKIVRTNKNNAAVGIGCFKEQP